MTSKTEGKGGSFRELRDRHLPLFDDSRHRHDRGWPRPLPEEGAEKGAKSVEDAGILHLRHDEQDDG